MANEAASIAVRIGADLAPLQQGLAKGSDSVSAFSAKSVTQLRNVASQAVKVGAAATAAGAAILAGLYVKGSQAIDAQAKLAQQLNTTSASMATLTRAGDLSGVSMEKITSGARALTVRLAQAAEGTGPAVDAMKQLGLTAEQLAQMPLDQRIATINARIQETVPAAGRAAMSARFFGEEAGTAFALLDSGTMARAAREAELFGLSLSDIDAAKVEQANDAMSTIGMATDGLIQQFTVELAPIIKAVSDRFVEAAEEAGGMGNVVSDAFESIVGVAGFVMDAVEGVKRAFSLAADGIIIYINKILEVASAGIAKMMELADAVPGIDMSESIASVQGFSDTAAGVVAAAQENIKATLSEPMPSEGLKKFVQEAQAAGQAAAEAAVKAREAAGGGAVATLDDARTPAEQEAIQKRLEAIRQANLTEIDLLKEKQAEEMALIAQARELGLETKATYDELEREAEIRHQEEMAEAKKRVAEQTGRWEDMNTTQRLNTLKGYFGQASSLMNSESRKMFEIGKAAAYAQAMINTFQGISEAWKLGPILGPPMAALVALNGFAQVQNIRKQKFGGGASSPTGSVTGQINAGNAPVQTTQEQQRNLYVTLQGINPNSFIRAGSLVSALNEELENGGRIRGMGFAA